MIKRYLLPALLLVAVAFQAKATVLFNETFSYQDGPLVLVGTNLTSTNWLTHSGTANQVLVAGGKGVITGNLTEDVSRSLGATQLLAFAKFTINATNLPTGAGSYFAHFRDTANGFRARLVSQTNGAAGGAYRLGITAAGSASAAVFPLDLLLTNTYQVVLAWDGSANAAYLWVNPSSDADLPVSESTGSGIVVTNFSFRQATGIGGFFVDDLSVGTTYADVAPPLVPTAILRSPVGFTANTGDSNALTVVATGSGPLSYQWKRDGFNVGGNTNLLTLPGLSGGDSGVYTVTVTGASGAPVTSVGVNVTVNTGSTPVSITASPVGTNVALGTTVSFVVGATGSNPITYQWYYNSNAIGGANSATLTLTAVSNANAGFYHAVATNPGNSATSAVAQLTVRGPIVTNIAYLRTLQDANYLPSDTTNLYTAEGVVTSWTTNLTTFGNTLVYMQDTNSAIAVFFSGSTNVPKAGDLIRVTGPLGTFSSLHEFNLTTNNPFHSIVVLSSDNPLPAPVNFEFSLTNNLPAIEALEGSLVTVTNVLIGASGNFGSGVNYVLTNSLGQILQLRIDARAGDIIGKAIPTNAVNITGLLAQNLTVGAADRKAGYQILPTRYVDFVTPSSHPAYSVVAAKGAGSTLVLTWTAQPAATYSVVGSDAVTGPFTNVVTGLSFSSGEGTYTVPASGSAGFFRVVTP